MVVDAAPVAYRQTFARLLGFLRPYKLSLVVSMFLAAASQAASIALILITAPAIDNAIKPHDHAKLKLYIVLILAIGLFKALCMVGRRLISGRPACKLWSAGRPVAALSDRQVRARTLSSRATARATCSWSVMRTS